MEPGFLDNLGGNSLEQLELVMAVEQAFEVAIPVEDAEKIRRLRSLQELLEYIRKRKKGGDSI